MLIFRSIIFFFLCFFVSFFIFPVIAETQMKSPSSVEFLKQTRAAHPIDTWAILKGKIDHKRNNVSQPLEANIRVGIRFTNDRALAKINISNIDNKNKQLESYTVGQTYDGAQPSIVFSNKNKSTIGNYGLRPDDLTMTFLYWNFTTELDSTSIKGINCRVFVLTHPKSGEKTIVYISSKYYYPIKVEWIQPREAEPYRTMVVNSFETQNNLGTPDNLSIYGPGWKTKVAFNEINLGYSKNGIPTDIFSN